MTEGQQNKPTPPPIPPKPPAPTSPKKALVIRTMRDDLTQARRAPVSGASPAAVTLMRKDKNGASTQVQGSAGSPPPPLPSTKDMLQPNLSAAKQAPEQIEAIVPKKKRNGVVVALLIIFIILAIGAGGLWFWLYLNDDTAEVAVPVISEDLTLAEVLPDSALLLAHYNVTDSAQLVTMQDAWGKASQEEDVTMVDAITGDPRLFLSNGISDFFYILLPGDPRFYIVIEGSNEVDQFLAGYSNIQVSRVGQWRVIHSFNTSLYEQALSQNSFAKTGRVVPTGAEDLIVTIDQELLSQTHKYAKNLFADVEAIDFSVSFSVEDGGVVATIANPVTPLVPPGVLVDTIQLLQNIPADATFVRIGESFASQIDRATTPSMKQFFGELVEPYVYYERIGDDGVNDAGLITRIPQARRESLIIPDAAVEEALGELIVAAGLGSKPRSGLTFTDVVYQEVPLRYVNVSSNQLALDYAVVGDFLMTSTSQEGMETAVSVAQNASESILDTPSWNTAYQAIADQSNNSILGVISQPAIKRLFPGGNSATELPFGLALDVAGSSQAINGTIVLP